MNDQQLNYVKAERTKLSSYEKLIGPTASQTDKLLLMMLDSMIELKGIMSFPDKKENPDYPETQTKNVTTAGTAEQLATIKVPYDCEVTIIAKTGNTGTIYVGKSKLDAEDDTKSVPLLKGASISYKIRTLANIWINSTVDGEGVIWTVEQEAKDE